MIDVQSIVEGAESPWPSRIAAIVDGTASSALFTDWVDRAWQQGSFPPPLPENRLWALPRGGTITSRYGSDGSLRCAIAFVHPHGPGGVVVQTPAALAPGTRYGAPPHVHGGAHLTVVLEGRALFFAATEPGLAGPLRTHPVAAGAVIPCPAQLVHTFGSSGESFTVLSLQARFIAPDRPDFAEPPPGGHRED